MIPISEVLEEAARVCDSVNNHDNPMTASDCAAAIRALAAKYEGCIVAEGGPLIMSHFQIAPFYRAKEPK
jgi:hypothetical protein